MAGAGQPSAALTMASTIVCTIAHQTLMFKHQPVGQSLADPSANQRFWLTKAPTYSGVVRNLREAG